VMTTVSALFTGVILIKEDDFSCRLKVTP